jgi:AcrR family transcriptional regulator
VDVDERGRRTGEGPGDPGSGPDVVQDDGPGAVDWIGADERGEHKAQTRRRLLDAATEVFLDRGPAHATLADVADRAGTTVDTVELYFASHHDLMSDLAEDLYVHTFRGYPTREDGSGLGDFLTAYLAAQARPETKLIWRLGDALVAESPEGPDTAYWHLIAEIEKRLVDTGASMDEAHSRALVLAPALLLVARRAAFDLATDGEMENFVVAACRCAATPA